MTETECAYRLLYLSAAGERALVREEPLPGAGQLPGIHEQSVQQMALTWEYRTTMELRSAVQRGRKPPSPLAMYGRPRSANRVEDFLRHDRQDLDG
jgi:hypothetical protein